MHEKKELCYDDWILIVGQGKSVVGRAVVKRNRSRRSMTQAKLPLFLKATDVNERRHRQESTCSSFDRPLCTSRFTGLSSIGTSINFERTRSRTESVMAKLRRSCASALSLRSAVDGPSVTLRRAARLVIIYSHPSTQKNNNDPFFGALALFTWVNNVAIPTGWSNYTL
jgi:hypothetical protein